MKVEEGRVTRLKIRGSAATTRRCGELAKGSPRGGCHPLFRLSDILLTLPQLSIKGQPAQASKRGFAFLSSRAVFETSPNLPRSVARAEGSCSADGEEGLEAEGHTKGDSRAEGSCSADGTEDPGVATRHLFPLPQEHWRRRRR